MGVYTQPTHFRTLSAMNMWHSDGLVARLNWCGSLSILRVLRLKEIPSVSGTLKPSFTDITSVDVQFGAEGTTTICTLAIMADLRL